MEKNGEAPAKTRGGCTLEQLCQGENNYVCDPRCLVELTKGETANDQVAILKYKVKEIFNIIEGDNNKIEKFFIGKTYVDKAGGAPFKAMDPKTWQTQGISSRWSGTYKPQLPKEEGKENPDCNGLIVLTVVTKEVLPHERNTTNDCEEYALMLEKRLQYYYKIENYDPRMKNDTFKDGNTCTKKDHEAFVVYIAVKFSKADDKIITEGMTNIKIQTD